MPNLFDILNDENYTEGLATSNVFEAVYTDYDKKEGWTDADIELHKSIDWESRKYKDFDTTEVWRGPVTVHKDEGLEEVSNVLFHKFLRSNPIYPPYYKPVEDPVAGMVGPMFDGHTYNGYDVHDRYESPEIYRQMSESFDKALNENKMPKDLATAYQKATYADSVAHTAADHVHNMGLRKYSKIDYGKATYKEISKEEALKIVKNKTEEVNNLRLIVAGKLIQFQDKGTYDGGWYRPLFQTAYINSLPYELAFTNKKGNLVYDSRKIPATYLVEIASKIYLTDEKEIGDDIIKRRLNTKSTADSDFQSPDIEKGGGWTRYVGNSDGGSRSATTTHHASVDLDTGNHRYSTLPYRYELEEVKRLKSLLAAEIKAYEQSKQKPGFDDELDKIYKDRINSKKQRYQKALLVYRDARAQFRNSYVASLSSMVGKAQRLKEIKNELKSLRNNLVKWKEKGFDTESQYERSLREIKRLEDQKADREKDLEVATSGKEAILKDIENLEKLIASKKDAIAQQDDDSAILGVTSVLSNAISEVNKTIEQYNSVVGKVDSLTQSLKLIKDQIAEREDEVDVAQADYEAASILAQIKYIETSIDRLIEEKRKICHKVVNNVQKEVNPDDPEFDLFRRRMSEIAGDSESTETSESLIDEGLKSDIDSAEKGTVYLGYDTSKADQYFYYAETKYSIGKNKDGKYEIGYEDTDPDGETLDCDTLGIYDSFEEALAKINELKLEDCPYDQPIEEEVVEEKFSDEELNKMTGKTYNQQKILNIYKRTKYDIPQLFAHTRCTKCGKEKRVLLSNLINDPDKYGSCTCSDDNEEGRAHKIINIYDGKKKLPTNTSGYTGIYHLKTYNGKPYNKWRATIEINGKKHHLGDFDTKKKAIAARKKAAKEGIKWYKQHM